MEVNVTGFKELREALLKLPKEIQGKPLASAVSAAAKVVQDEAKKNSPLKTGKLRDNVVRYKAKKYSNAYQVTYHVGMKKEWLAFADNVKNRRSGRAGKKYSRDKIYYWRFHEFGTVKMPARPFFRPAFESTKSEQLDTMQKRLAKAIEAARKKLAKLK